MAASKGSRVVGAPSSGLVCQTISPVMAASLGLQVERGVIVSDIRPEGPTDIAGTKPDDIVIALNDRKILSARQLEFNVYQHQVGSTVILRIQRGSEQMSVPVKVERESDKLQDLADTLDPEENFLSQIGVVGLDINQTLLSVMPELQRPAGVFVAIRNPDAPYSGLRSK